MPDTRFVVFDNQSYQDNYDMGNSSFYVEENSSNQELYLHKIYFPSDDNIIHTFSYSDGYEITLYTGNFNSSSPDDGWNYQTSGINSVTDINNWLSNNDGSDTKIDFSDYSDDPGDDPDDPGDDTTYTLVCFSENSVHDIGTYTSDEPISFSISGHDIYDYNNTLIFSDTNGNFYVDQFDSNWNKQRTYINSVNFDLSDLDYEDVYLVFHNVEVTDLTGYSWIGNDSINLDAVSSWGTKSIYFTSNSSSYVAISGDSTSLNYHTSIASWNTAYNSLTVGWTNIRFKFIDEFTGGDNVTNIDLIIWLMANGTLTAPPTPTRPDKTKIGGSSIRLKKIGNVTVAKEVLNGVVIYTAE